VPSLSLFDSILLPGCEKLDLCTDWTTRYRVMAREWDRIKTITDYDSADGGICSLHRSVRILAHRRCCSLGASVQSCNPRLRILGILGRSNVMKKLISEARSQRGKGALDRGTPSPPEIQPPLKSAALSQSLVQDIQPLTKVLRCHTVNVGINVYFRDICRSINPDPASNFRAEAARLNAV